MSNQNESSSQKAKEQYSEQNKITESKEEQSAAIPTDQDEQANLTMQNVKSAANQEKSRDMSNLDVTQELEIDPLTKPSADKKDSLPIEDIQNNDLQENKQET